MFADGRIHSSGQMPDDDHLWRAGPQDALLHQRKHWSLCRELAQYPLSGALFAMRTQCAGPSQAAFILKSETRHVCFLRKRPLSLA